MKTKSVMRGCPECAGWRGMNSAPKNATWIQVLTRDNQVFEAHWASGDGGGEQSPFCGWFRKSGDEFVEVEPYKWHPLD